MGDTCPQCGNEYQIIGTHWSKSSSCEHPSFNSHQNEIITGLLMGDGTINKGRDGSNPRLQVEMTSPKYLYHVNEQFGILGCSVQLSMTGEESAKKTRDSGFSPRAKPKNYDDLYVWRSRSHPELNNFIEWYETGRKVWPNSINLTPTVLKHWYCGDGSWNNTNSNNFIHISMWNEVENREKVNRMFENVGLPSPSNYNIHEKRCSAEFTVSQSKELWEYMGEPLPDFEYKWPDRYC